MTFKTLKYIHSLLVEDVENKRLAAQRQRDIWIQADADDTPSAATLKEIYDDLRSEANAASDALEEFENKEW